MIVLFVLFLLDYNILNFEPTGFSAGPSAFLPLSIEKTKQKLKLKSLFVEHKKYLILLRSSLVSSSLGSMHI